MKLALPIPFLLCLAFPFFIVSSLPAATYYVATNGNDSNPGTLASPWRTVQKAAATMVAGDTVYIRGGTYRETVVPANSGTPSAPITFEAYGSEIVVISGLNSVAASWTQYSGNIYSAPVAMTLGDQNQVFINGEPGTLARWPNDDGNLFTHNGAVVDSGGLTSITDAELPAQPANWYNGALVWISAEAKWTCQAWTIASSSGSTINFTNNAPDWVKGAHNPGATAGTDVNYYYIAGLLGLLDAGREWFYNVAEGRLYLQTPDGGSPSGYSVEVKARELAFNIAQSHIRINRLQLKGAKVLISGNNNIFENIAGSYMFHHNARGMSWWYPAVWPATGSFFVSGSNNTIRNSDIRYSAGSLIALGTGSMNTTIDNNYLLYANYNGSYDSSIHASDDQVGSAIVTRNTMHTCGRSLLHLGTDITGPWTIKWNDCSNPMIFTDDGAGLYTYGYDMHNTVVAYNRFHDQIALNARNSSPGLYVDDWTKNIIFHHNVVYNINAGQSSGIKVGAGTVGKRFYNNTFHDIPATLVLHHGGGTSSLVNSVHNLAASNFVNGAAGDFRLAAGSAAINSGVTGAPWTDDYAGAAPDKGAYEYGGPARLSNWTTGVGSTIYPDVITPPPASLPVGVVNNSTVGTGNGQWEYAGPAGAWENVRLSGAVLDDVHRVYSGAGRYAQLRFTGGRIQLYAWKYSNFGAGGVSIDGGPETPVSFNGSGNYTVQMVYDSGNLPPGEHILKVSAATGGVTIDCAEISPVNDIIVDNTAATLAGSWSTSGTPVAPGFYSTNYRHDSNSGKGAKTMRFTPTIPAAGTYEVYGRWTEDANRAANVPYAITHAGGTANITVDQRTDGGKWVLLGTYDFTAGTSGSVLISNTGTNGYVIADAVRFVATAQTPPPAVSVDVAATDAAASEPGSNTGVFTISRNTTVGDLAIGYTLGGSAAAADYTLDRQTPVLIPNGQSSVTITVVAVDDALVENTETVQLTLSASANYAIGAGSAMVNISDDDQALPVIDASVADANAAEPGQNAGVFTLTRNQTAGNLTVYYSLGGSASGVDYTANPSSGSVMIPNGQSSASVTITPVDDLLAEGGETVQLTVSPNGNYAIGAASAWFQIADDDQTETWGSQDIGTTSIAGSATYDAGNDTFTVKGSGTGVSGTADSFHFMYRPMTGDGQIIARVNSISANSSWARGGLMIRASRDADAAFAFAYVTKSAGAGFSRRITAGATVSSSSSSGPVPPLWLKLVRAGAIFTAYRSNDGSTWTSMGSQTISMANTVYIGMGVSSNLSNNLATVLFDSVAAP